MALPAHKSSWEFSQSNSNGGEPDQKAGSHWLPALKDLTSSIYQAVRSPPRLRPAITPAAISRISRTPTTTAHSHVLLASVAVSTRIDVPVPATGDAFGNPYPCISVRSCGV